MLLECFVCLLRGYIDTVAIEKDVIHKRGQRHAPSFIIFSIAVPVMSNVPFRNENDAFFVWVSRHFCHRPVRISFYSLWRQLLYSGCQTPIPTMLKSHYDTLGVAHTATTQEIKKAYRQLCLQTHPDVAGPESLERFKAIAHAHDILSNTRQRQMYDRELRYRTTWGNHQHGHGGSSSGYGRPTPRGPHTMNPEDLRSYYEQANHDFVKRARAASSSASSAGMFGGRGAVSASTLVSVGLGLVAIWWLSPTVKEDRSSVAQFRPNPRLRNDEVVEAWKNPDTGFWEQPAPWDPTYRRLQPKLELVPRHQVRQRTF